MSNNNFHRFTSADVLKAIRPKHLAAVLQPHSEYLASRHIVVQDGEGEPKIDFLALLEVLARPDAGTPVSLLEAFHRIYQLGLPAALNQLLDEAFLASVKLDRSQPMTPEDIAAQLWVSGRPILDQVLGDRLSRRRRTFDYFQGTGRRNPTWRAPARETLHELELTLDGWFDSHLRGRGSKVLVYPRNGGCMFVVRHGQPMRRVGIMHEGLSTAVSFRPEKHDVVVYDGRVDELQVNAETDGEKALYRTAFGRHLFGSESYFPGGGKYTLEPLRRAGPHTLDASDVAGIENVRLCEVEYCWPGYSDEIVTRRSDEDLLPILGKHGKGIHHEAHLLSASFLFKFKLVDRPRLVTIRPANVAEYARDGDAELVERWLQSRKFMSSEAA